jgi:hypothetical protein
MTMFHLKRRVRAVVANVVDTMVSPFGWYTNVMRTSGLPGIDGWWLFKLPPGWPRARRIKPLPYRSFRR